MIFPKVSVIVPAYNSEKYLECCLNSIAVQTMPDFECIIVDDGSTDKTGEIADSYAKKDPRFQVIHQSNSGVAVARQRGINASSGIYTIQFDSDDWVERTILEDLFTQAKKSDADMVMCDINVITPSENTIWSQEPASLESKIVLGQMMQQLCCGLWNKLIKRSCYQEYHIQFVSGQLSEDLYVCLCLLAHPMRIEYVPKALYHYDQTKNPGSLSKNLILSLARLKSLELFADYHSLSKVQGYYDNAILQTAYDTLLLFSDKCSNYSEIFKKHLPSIYRAKGYPFRVKVLVLLRIYGIYIPVQSIKTIWKKIISSD